ncbi:sigma factor [Paracoccus sp. WLY502]|uniref:sigma factor n=1 Tax=Paracoccus yibinensis TaxID=3068891 RepID=UPI0027966BE8|nr:sigma factor [Paracoccus sp. WLY502]MDQ1899637.1 sigma factor [Paracoccus sp. WLY502]
MQHDRQPLLADLIARVAKADRRAFDELYETTSARLNALCLSILKDRREAEETLEQAYIGIWNDAGRYRESGLSPMAWLVTQARDRAVDRLRGLPGPVPAGAGHKRGGGGLDLVRIAYLEGLDYSLLGQRLGISADEARHALHEGLERLAGHAADEGVSFATAEQALALREGEPQDQAQLADWKERLAGFAGDLTPVMAPARARQRIRESLGHGVAPLSVDPLERRSWWRGPWGVVAILLVAALAWYFWMGQG